MYNVMIVGARCAGAPTAMLLARKGYRVLLADRASFPSDTISTHIIWPHGAGIMDRWDLLHRLAATGCPPVALNLIFDVGPFALKGAVLIAVLRPSSRFEKLRADIEGHVRKVLESTPGVRDRLRDARRETKWFGTAGVPNYFRRPFGPGWALAGDAGYDKDPITAQGISDAFIDAEHLTAALDDGWSGRRPPDDALADYQSSRDQRAKPDERLHVSAGDAGTTTAAHAAALYRAARQPRGHEPVLFGDHRLDSRCQRS